MALRTDPDDPGAPQDSHMHSVCLLDCCFSFDSTKSPSIRGERFLVRRRAFRAENFSVKRSVKSS